MCYMVIFFFQMSEFVKPDQKTIIREPSNIVCKEDDRLRLLVVVYSAPVYYERRRIIRKTWGDALRKIPGKIWYFLRHHLTGSKVDHTVRFLKSIAKSRANYDLAFQGSALDFWKFNLKNQVRQTGFSVYFKFEIRQALPPVDLYLIFEKSSCKN